GGLEQLVVQLAARSRARGIESSILALGHDGPIRKLALKQGISVELLPVDGMSFPALMGIRRELEKREASVLHAHDLGPWLNGVAVRALRPKTRVMATFHEQRTPEGRRRQEAALAARATDVLVACGDKVRQDILGWAPSGARVPVIANGVPLESQAFTPRGAARAELGIPEGAVAIGYVGGLREIKGPDRLLQAFLDKFADRADVHLVLIGEGPLEESLRATARGHANVHFKGLIPEAARLLPALDVYAQTSLSEGRSLTSGRARSCTAPIGRCWPSLHRLPAPTCPSSAPSRGPGRPAPWKRRRGGAGSGPCDSKAARGSTSAARAPWPGLPWRRGCGCCTRTTSRPCSSP